jgi:hypothetical protein
MDWYKRSRVLRTYSAYLVLTPSQRYFLGELMQLSFNEDTPGRLLQPETHIRAFLGVGPKRWERLLAILLENKIVSLEEDGSLTLARWLFPHYSDAEMTGVVEAEPSNGNGHHRGNGHNGKPSDEPERVKERVERHRKQNVTPLVTPPEPDCNAPDSHARAIAIAQEAEAEADPFVSQKAEAEADPPTPHEATSPNGRASALPCPAFSDKSDSASALPLTAASGSPPLLSKYDEQDLVRSGWTLSEIDIGLAILRERNKSVGSVKGVLVKGLLQEVRDGKRPKSVQKALTMPYTVPGGKSPPAVSQLEQPTIADALSVLSGPEMTRAVIAQRDIERHQQEEARRQQLREQARQQMGGPG